MLGQLGGLESGFIVEEGDSRSTPLFFSQIFLATPKIIRKNPKNINLASIQ